MRTITTIDRNFEGVTLENNYYVYNDDLNIEGDAAIFENIVIKGNLVVNGKLDCHENLEVFGEINVSGDFIAAAVIADYISVGGDLVAADVTAYGTIEIEGNAEINNIISFNLAIGGNIKAAGTIRTEVFASIEGNLTAENMVGGFFQIGRKVNVSRIYAPLSF